MLKWKSQQHWKDLFLPLWPQGQVHFCPVAQLHECISICKNATLFCDLLPFRPCNFWEELLFSLVLLTLARPQAMRGLQLGSFSAVPEKVGRTLVKQCAGLSSLSEWIEIRDPIEPDIWVSVFVFGREGLYLETWEGGSALYKTTEGSLAFAWAASIREQMGLSRHRNVSRHHKCLWKAKDKFCKELKGTRLPLGLGSSDHS